MKTFFTLIMPVLIIGLGYAGFILFQQGAYVTSACCIAASHLTGAYWIYKLISKKKTVMQ
jgi:hypothetical protein